MLDFLLVLGQIPGTDLQITFNDYILLIMIGAAYYWRRQLRLWLIAKRLEFIIYLRLRYWAWKQLSLPL